MDALTGSPSLARSEDERRQADADLERQISDAKTQMLAALTVDCARSWALKMAELIAQRSPERIREMESERGLCP